MVGIYNYIPETIQFVLHAVNLQTPTEYIQHVALNDRTKGVDNLILSALDTGRRVIWYRGTKGLEECAVFSVV